MRNPAPVLGFALCVTAAAGCGRSDLPAAAGCTTFSPCGGDIGGTWKVDTLCGEQANVDPTCPGATLDSTGVKLTGSYTFNANMTYASSIGFTGAAKVTYPRRCLGLDRPGTSCEAGAAVLTLLFVGPDRPIAKLECRTAGDNCECTITGNGNPAAESGTWMRSGNTITMTGGSGGSSTSAEYCSASGSLAMRTMAAQGGAPGAGSPALDPTRVAGTILLKKQ